MTIPTQLNTPEDSEYSARWWPADAEGPAVVELHKCGEVYDDEYAATVAEAQEWVDNYDFEALDQDDEPDYDYDPWDHNHR